MYAIRERHDYIVAMTAFSATPLDMPRPNGDANPGHVQDDLSGGKRR